MQQTFFLSALGVVGTSGNVSLLNARSDAGARVGNWIGGRRLGAVCPPPEAAILPVRSEESPTDSLGTPCPAICPFLCCSAAALNGFGRFASDFGPANAQAQAADSSAGTDAAADGELNVLRMSSWYFSTGAEAMELGAAEHEIGFVLGTHWVGIGHSNQVKQKRYIQKILSKITEINRKNTETRFHGYFCELLLFFYYEPHWCLAPKKLPNVTKLYGLNQQSRLPAATALAKLSENVGPFIGSSP